LATDTLRQPAFRWHGLGMAGSMATFPGLQSELSDLLRALIELDYDAADAYTVAIGRILSQERRTALEEFRSDHLRHAYELGRELRDLGHDPPLGSDARSVLTQGKVVLGTITGDKGILKAIRSNAKDTHRAYARALHRGDLSPGVARLVRENLADEQRHLNWIQDQLTNLGELDEDQHITPRELPR
jgi:rubrerythrin